MEEEEKERKKGPPFPGRAQAPVRAGRHMGAGPRPWRARLPPKSRLVPGAFRTIVAVARARVAVRQATNGRGQIFGGSGLPPCLARKRFGVLDLRDIYGPHPAALLGIRRRPKTAGG